MDGGDSGARRHLIVAVTDGQLVQSAYGPVTIRHHAAGDLVVTSGSIVACDPTSIQDGPQPFVTRVEPGRYPVIIGIAHLPNGDERVAFAMLRSGEQDPVRWEIARRLEDETVDDYYYSVDGGKSCFMDVDALHVLLRRLEGEEIDDEPIYAEMDIGPGPLELISEAVNAAYRPTWGWANVSLEPATAANIVGFSSGFGDGAYATYLGYNAIGTLVCFATDFALFNEELELDDNG